MHSRKSLVGDEVSSRRRLSFKASPTHFQRSAIFPLQPLTHPVRAGAHGRRRRRRYLHRRLPTHPVQPHELLAAPAAVRAPPLYAVPHLIPHPEQRDVEDEEDRQDADTRQVAVEQSRPLGPILRIIWDERGGGAGRGGAGQTSSGEAGAPGVQQRVIQSETTTTTTSTPRTPGTEKRGEKTFGGTFDGKQKQARTVGSMVCICCTHVCAQHVYLIVRAPHPPPRPATAALRRRRPSRRRTTAGCGPTRTGLEKAFCPGPPRCRRPPPTPTGGMTPARWGAASAPSPCSP